MLKSSGFRFLTHKDYLLFCRYERAEGRVYIMAIFHGRRDYLRVMQQYL
jgi:plasmid stabilization system protein ParE